MGNLTEAKNRRYIGKTGSKRDFLLESLKIVVDGIAQTFGPRCEVVLHDLKDLDRSIIKIANGHVTGRTVGGSVTDKGLRDLRSGCEDSHLINYPSTTKEGRRLKSTTMILRNEKNVPIAALCINFDVTDILSFKEIIENTFKISEEADQGVRVETFDSDIITTLSKIADEIIREMGKAIPSMVREDKIEIVRQLEEQGLFLIKGAIKFIARKLNISKFTIYNYLDQIRSENKTLKSH